MSQMTDRNLTLRVLSLALPVLTEQLLAVGVGLVDTWLTGNYLPGDKYLAAIGQMAYIMWLIPSLFAFVSIGTTALVARSVGAGEMDTAEKVANQSFMLGFGLAGVITLALAFGGETLVRWLQLPQEAADLALIYLKCLVPVVPAMMFERVAIAALQGAGDTVTGMWVRLVVNLANILLSLALVLGWLWLPPMGWAGIAWGTAVSHLIGGAILFLVLLRGRRGIQIRWRCFRPDFVVVGRILRVGIPGGLDVLLILICHLSFVAMINGMGTASAAAHSLVIRIESLAYLPGAAFQIAATTLAGQFLGAKDPRSASRSVLFSLWWGGGVMTTAGVVFFLAGFPLASFFAGSGNAETAFQAAKILRIVAFAMPFLATSMIVSGALRGAGDTRWPMFINLLGMAGIRLPGTYLVTSYLSPWILNTSDPLAGLRATWCVVLVDLVVRAVMVLVRFFQGGWKETTV